jgi:hypothetical protein
MCPVVAWRESLGGERNVHAGVGFDGFAIGDADGGTLVGVVYVVAMCLGGTIEIVAGGAGVDDGGGYGNVIR